VNRDHLCLKNIHTFVKKKLFERVIQLKIVLGNKKSSRLYNRVDPNFHNSQTAIDRNAATAIVNSKIAF